MAHCLRGDAAEVFRVEVFEVGLSHSDGNCDSQAGVVDEGHNGVIAPAADDVLVSAFVHPVAVLSKVFQSVVGDSIGPYRLVELIQTLVLGLPFLLPSEAGASAPASDEGLDEGDALVDAGDRYQQIVRVAVVFSRCQVVSAE